MAITNLDQLLDAMGNSRQKYPLSKLAIGNMLAGQSGSYWRQGGFPPVGSIPAAAIVCNQNTLGGVPYVQPTAGKKTYLSRLFGSSSIAGSIEIHDRLAHMGGLQGTLTTAQTVGIDLNAMAGTDNLLERLGRPDFAAVQWWIEGYTQLGTTASTATVSYTDHNGTAGRTVTVAIPANFRAAALLPIVPIPGDNIRSVESVTLSVTTGIAGNFGVTASLQRAEVPFSLANIPILCDWASLGLPPIYDNSCLWFLGNASTTTLGAFNGAMTLVQG